MFYKINVCDNSLTYFQNLKKGAEKGEKRRREFKLYLIFKHVP